MNTISHMPSTKQHKALRLARRPQGVTTREIAATGIHRQALTRLVATGHIDRVARGMYRVPGHDVTEHHSLVLACTAVPQGVITLISALQFHRIGTQLASRIWIALDRRARHPALKHPPLRVVRYTGEALAAGIETHRIEGQSVRVYNPAKTVADCFKYRNKIGLDVALEALREGWRMRSFKLDELDRYARICRVQRVMRPYVEAMVA